MQWTEITEFTNKSPTPWDDDKKPENNKCRPKMSSFACREQLAHDTAKGRARPQVPNEILDIAQVAAQQLLLLLGRHGVGGFATGAAPA